MANTTRRPTLADVAHRANVSITSVSRLINHSGPINLETRARIEAAMTELGFEPRASEPKEIPPTIAVITGSIMNSYFPEVIRGVQEEADSHNMLTLLFTLPTQAQRRQNILEKLARRVADGVVVMGSPVFPGLDDLQARLKLPMVVINRRYSGTALGSITVDFENAGYRATQHLLAFGHTRIGYIAPVEGVNDTLSSRRRGMEQAIRDAGLAINPQWMVSCPPSGESDSGFYAMNNLLRLPDERPTALVCFNDSIAVGVAHAIRAAGLRVPDDISIVSFGDIAVAAHACPPLTTISQPKYSIGMMAVQMLRKMLQDPSAPGDIIETESPLVVRESTGPCPKR